MSNHDSPSWILFNWASFAIALLMAVIGIWLVDANVWMKGYLAMSMLLLVNASISLTKTIRDQHEMQKLHNRIDDARTERLLKETELA
ncbi:MAG: YiaA/YiaB family inner membrane protein [Bauldia litoralis]